MPLGLDLSIGAKRQQDYEQGIDPNDSSLTSLQVWYRGDRGAVIDGSNRVSQWTDQSVNNIQFLQGTDALKPVLTNSVFGGNPALYFDGNNDFLSMASNASLSYVNDSSFTFVMWIYPLTNALIFSKRNGISGPYYEFWFGSNLVMNGPSSYPGNTLQVSMTSPETPVWWHKACTYNGNPHPSGVKWYLNGLITPTLTIFDTLSGSTWNPGVCALGAESGISSFFKGYIYEFASWNAVLTDAQILRLYNRSKWPLGI